MVMTSAFLLAVMHCCLTAVLSLSYGLKMSFANKPVVVIGSAGGAAETIAYKLMSAATKSTVTVILDRKPISSSLKQCILDTKSEVYWGESLDKEVVNMNGRMTTIDQLLENKVVIAVGDTGDDTLRQFDPKKRDTPASILDAVSRKLPTNMIGMLCSIDSASDGSGGIGGLFGRKISDSLNEFCTKNNVPFSLLKYGKLTGGVPGNEPLPFMGLPALEPELHPSYILRSVILTDTNNQYSSSDICTRESLAEATVRLLNVEGGESLQGQVVSIAGEPPSDKEWMQLFSRLKSSDNVEILRVEFGEVLKPQALLNWVADTWFPQALIDADAATILAGARPVRASKIGDKSIRIVWEDMQPDLTIKTVGGVELKLITENASSPPALVAVRLSGKSLPGEMQLMDRLIEGINKSVYKKQICTPAQ
jgi:hypothetical protein